MANKDQVVGLRPWGSVRSAKRYKAGGTVYPGDLVKMDNSGQVVQCAASEAAIGVAMEYCTSGNKVLVADHPDQKFVIQSDDGSVDAQTDIGLNYNITVSSADTLYKRSGMELDGSTGATDSTLPLRLLEVSEAIDNALGTNADVIVKINNHQLGNKIEGA